MSLSAKIRAQIINSFRAELEEHIQTMTSGLLAIEQDQLAGEQRRARLEDIFRAAHSLKGAARAVGVTVVEQAAHSLESVLDSLLRGKLMPFPALFSACYETLDAIQSVQAAYEAGETTPPARILQAMAGLEQIGIAGQSAAVVSSPAEATPEPAPAPAAPVEPAMPRSPTAEVETPPSVRPERLASARQSDLAGPAPVANVPPVQSAPPQPIPVASEGSQRLFDNDETIRVKVTKLDSLMDQLSELLIMKIRTEQRLVQVREVQALMDSWQKEWSPLRNAYSHLLRQQVTGAISIGLGKDNLRLLEYLGESQEHVRTAQALLNTLAREYAGDASQMSLAVDDLEQEVKRLRMLPLSIITAPFGRMVRDLSLEAGKEATLQIVGGDTELDKRVLEQIKDPLIHMLRNAVDHGIETPKQRLACGKSRVGAITLSAQQVGKDVVITIADDGAGLDIEAIRRSVARQGKADAQALTSQELADYVFKIGVSTSPIITDLSGRGVGLDVVRRNIEALHGQCTVAWTEGVGTSFTIVIPLRLTGSRGLLVRVAGQVYAIPNSAVEFILAVRPAEIIRLGGHDAIRHRGASIPLVRLADVLAVSRPSAPRHDEEIPVVILASADRRMAFVVDELVGEQEIVIKGLGKQLLHVNGLAGATIMGNGEVVLILNASDLVKFALKNDRPGVAVFSTPVADPGPSQRRILIVDDSITTRTLEKNILEAAGYRVELAFDGQEALNAITANGLPDLVVSDVAMPRVNGFELTRRIKNSAQTAALPVILVSSLDSAEDRAQGIDAGAEAYITKGSFDQNNLLETIEQLLMPLEPRPT